MPKIKIRTLISLRSNRCQPAIAIGVALTLSAGGWLLAQQTSPTETNTQVAAAPGAAAATGSLSPSNPTKEYIYAGSRLVAIEEAGGSSLAAPSGLEATGGSGPQITIGWAATPGAHHYQVERADVAGEFITISDNIPSTTYSDSVASDRAYLYRVRAADAAGNLSQPSKMDLATSVAFTDNPLSGHDSTGPGTPIKADHLKELRRAVNAVRALTGLAPVSWSHPDPVSAPAQRRKIYLADVLELRGGLDAALSILGMQRPHATDPNLTGGYVKAAHFQELRDRVR